MDNIDDDLSISKQDWSEKLKNMEMKDVLDIDINEDDQMSTFLEMHKQRKMSSDKKTSQDESWPSQICIPNEITSEVKKKIKSHDKNKNANELLAKEE